MNFTPALFIAAALLTTSPAFAEKSGDGRDHEARRAAMFDNMDANEDGAISREEFANPHAKRFKEADTDNNGSISPAEFEAKMMERAKSHAARMFERLDKNSDGAIDKDEIAAMRGHKFARMGRHGRHMMGRSGMDHGSMGRKGFDNDGDHHKSSR